MPARLKPNYSKIIESILFLIQQAEARGVEVTQYQLVKSIFIADDDHLKRFGRPVTFCNYAAMPFGPVPSEAYDLLKPGFDWSAHGGTVPWRVEAAPQISKTAHTFHLSGREPNKGVLSVSDQDALGSALDYVVQNGFGTVKDFTHNHKAYVNAWKEGHSRKSFPINYLDMIPDMDLEHMSELVHASRYI